MLSAESSTRATKASARLSDARIPEVPPIPNLIELQLDSFRWFIANGLRELFDEISPIKDFTGKVMELQFLDYEFGIPKYTELECRAKDLTYSQPLYVNVELLIKETGEIQRQRVYMGDFPVMTDQGTFIINGAERVVVSQLVRSPGGYYSATEDPTSGRTLFSAKVIPNRGAWLEFETSNKDLLSVKVDRKRKIAATTLLRAVGFETNEEIAGLFTNVDTDPDHPYVTSTLDKDLTKNQHEALIEVYKKLRPGDPPTGDNARQLVESLFFNFRRYDLGRVGRYKFNKKLDAVTRRMGIELKRDERTITREDIAAIVGHLIELNIEAAKAPSEQRWGADDIDHLGNRRIRANGELIQNAFRIGLLRMERVVRERMTIQEIDKATPNALINIRPVVAAMKEFFGGSQLSQFMDQTNPLAELTSKRRLSALGPGGLSRERAGFDVRDVHQSHYGRICPIETPEGPNIGLIGSLATFARVNEFGFIETPFRRVYKDEKGTPWVSDEIVFLSADEEDKYTVAQANAPVDEKGHFAVAHVACRTRHTFKDLPIGDVDFMDVSPKQIVSVATALIPFLEHDDANRALMGSNMQKQAVPLLVSESPIVGTGMEIHAARNSGEMVLARKPGTVVGVAWPEPSDSDRSVEKILSGQDSGIGILGRPDDGGPDQWYGVHKFVRSNQGTCLSQRITVLSGARVNAGDVLADGPSTDDGELALGRNLLVAFMPWEGYNFEDAILITESAVGGT